MFKTLLVISVLTIAVTIAGDCNGPLLNRDINPNAPVTTLTEPTVVDDAGVNKAFKGKA